MNIDNVKECAGCEDAENAPHASDCETRPIQTWADGYGRWHADVPDTPHGYTKAANAIAYELASRSPWNYSEAFAYVETNIISLPSDTPGRVHFAEYAID